jgi:putative DNA primase/helicase
MLWIANEVGPMITGTVWIMSVDDPDLPKGWDVADAVETDGKGAEWLDKFRSNILPDGLPRLRRINKAPIPAAIIKEQQNGLPDETPIVDVERKMLGHEPIVDGDATERWYNKPWKHRFMTGGQDNQQLIKCDHNIAVPLRYAPELQGAIRFNSISKKIEKSRPLPWGEAPGEWKATTTTRLLAWLNKMGLYYSKEMMEDAVSVVAEEMEFNPLVEYLEQLKWDGRPRVEEWLSTYTGAASNLYTREIGKRWMVSAIARGMQPGCKADSMIVMEGNEGTRKSTTLRALGTPAGEYFAQLRGSIGGSDFRANFQAATHWIIELGELEAVNRTQWESLKDFLSTQSESVRLAYHKHQQTLYRSCVFAGTVNETRGGWLPLDGDHRRFWPVRVNYCDLDGIMRDRDQLWAEARALFESGQKWWIDPDETELMGVVKVERDERKFNDEWVGAVSTWLDRPQQWQDEFAMRDIAWGALSISADRLDKATQLRLGKVLVAAGMERVKVRRGGETVWMWRKPGATAPISDEL